MPVILTVLEYILKLREMKKLIIIMGLLITVSSIKAQQSRYDLFETLDAAYLPDENTTYFVEDINISTNSEDEDLIIFKGIKAKMKGNYIDVLVNANPSLRPIVKKEKHREKFEDYTGAASFSCIKGGLICVIIIKKNQHLGGF